MFEGSRVKFEGTSSLPSQCADSHASITEASGSHLPTDQRLCLLTGHSCFLYVKRVKLYARYLNPFSAPNHYTGSPAPPAFVLGHNSSNYLVAQWPPLGNVRKWCAIILLTCQISHVNIFLSIVVQIRRVRLLLDHGRGCQAHLRHG
jgi:hypothetical protein